VQKDVGPWTFDGVWGTQSSISISIVTIYMADFSLNGNWARSWNWQWRSFLTRAKVSPLLKTQSSTLIDAGGYYHFKYPGLELLFAYGHSVAGQTENYGYLGLYYTWGKRQTKEGRWRRNAIRATAQQRPLLTWSNYV